MFQALTTGPIGTELQMIAAIVGLVIGVVLHEAAHGYVAFRLGDPTAYYLGRVTLNPLKHIDLWGTILVPLILIISRAGFVFGWAKPVPVNYYNLRYGNYGPVMVALAGPGTNFLLVVVFGLLARFSPPTTALPFLFVTIALINAVLMFFNLIPIPPLDGSKVLYLILHHYHRSDIVEFLERYSFYIIIVLLLFGAGLVSRFVIGPALALTRLFAGF